MSKDNKKVNTERMTKWRTDSIYKPSDLNTHDPHNQHRWADEGLPLWVLPLYLLGGCAFMLGIGYLVFLGLLL